MATGKDGFISSESSPVRGRGKEGGFALLTTVIIVLIAGILLTGTISRTRDTERTAGNAIQYSRAMEAAEGGAVVAENEIRAAVGTRIFADDSASEGMFSLNSVENNWWDNPTYDGQQSVDPGILLGVFAPPRYVKEMVGNYIADGGTGIVNMDIGGAAYGRQSAGAREHVLHRVQSQGVGSKDSVKRVIETLVIVTK